MMKNSLIFTGVLLFASFLCTSCGKSELEKDGEKYGNLMCQYQKIKFSDEEKDKMKASELLQEIQVIFDKYKADKVGQENNDKFQEECAAHLNDCE